MFGPASGLFPALVSIGDIHCGFFGEPFDDLVGMVRWEVTEAGHFRE
jgi:hypothetical protein